MSQIIEITDLSLPALDTYARLTENQLRNRLEPQKGIFIAESLKVIRSALAAGCRPVSFLMERKKTSGRPGKISAGSMASNPRVYGTTGDTFCAHRLCAYPGDPLCHGTPHTAPREQRM